ncbi:MAG: hypothetical protein OEZ39_11075 [Gammaproteobacteria bacterium]|nr:hypothetical protein [Gammaproteobacteria bacterium]
MMDIIENCLTNLSLSLITPFSLQTFLAGKSALAVNYSSPLPYRPA